MEIRGVYVHDLSSFVKQGIYNDNSGLIFWNYKNSTGYEYPELTYSRNVYFSLFDDSSFDAENNKITLKSPWSNGTIPAKTKVSQTMKGNTYNYGLADSSRRLTTKYKLCENNITGINYKADTVEFKEFRPGTKYIKILFYLNYKDIENSQIDVKDIIFAELE